MKVSFKISSSVFAILSRAFDEAHGRAEHASGINGTGTYTTLSSNVFTIKEDTFSYQGRRGGFVEGIMLEQGVELQKLLKDCPILEYKTAEPSWTPFDTAWSKASHAQKVLISQRLNGAESYKNIGVVAVPYPWEWSSQWGAKITKSGVWTTYEFLDGSQLKFDGKYLLELD